MLSGCDGPEFSDSDAADTERRHSGLLEIVKVTPGDTASSLEVKVTVLYDGNEVTAGDAFFDAEAEISLAWQCQKKSAMFNDKGEPDYRPAGDGEIKISLAKGSGSSSHTFNDLPLPSADFDLECWLAANSVEIIPAADDDRTRAEALSEQSHREEFWKKADGKHQAGEEDSGAVRRFTIKYTAEGVITAKLAVTKITAGSSATLVDAKVAIVKGDGSALKQGDDAFDLDFDLVIQWLCSPGRGSPMSTIEVGKNKGEATATMQLLGRPADKTITCDLSSYSGIPSRTEGIDGKVTTTTTSGDAVSIGVRKIVIGARSYAVSRELSFTITSQEDGKPLVYDVVDKDSAAAINRVDMHLSSGSRDDCDDATLVHLAADKGSVEYGKWVDGVSGKSDGRVFIVGAGNHCVLMAAVGEDLDRQHGESSRFNVFTRASFTLNRSAQVTPNGASYTGKLRVFTFDTTGSSELVGYLDARGISGATKLKTSAATDAGVKGSLAAGEYIVFVENAAQTSVHLVVVN